MGIYATYYTTDYHYDSETDIFWRPIWTYRATATATAMTDPPLATLPTTLRTVHLVVHLFGDRF